MRRRRVLRAGDGAMPLPVQYPCLAKLPLSQKAVVVRVGGERTVRRRLMEMGLTPGVQVSVVSVSPLGDPLQLSLRGGRMSIRKKEALAVEVRV